MTDAPTRYLRGVDWDGVKAKLEEPAKAPGLVLHATDSAGRAAHEAAMMAAPLRDFLLAASSPFADRGMRANAFAEVFATWPKLCRAMSVLEGLAPTARGEGEAWDARLHDFAEELQNRQKA